MITLKSFHFDDKEINVGVPTKIHEKEEMFALRKKEYLARGYTTRLYRNGDDTDEYDYTEECEYFIAEYKEKVIGCVRLIRAIYLPTETYFDFIEPEPMRYIPRENMTGT